jgi:hypothetical protein
VTEGAASMLQRVEVNELVNNNDNDPELDDTRRDGVYITTAVTLD